jgi:hypothetical protein
MPAIASEVPSLIDRRVPTYQNPCGICGFPAKRITGGPGLEQVECMRCGQYRLTEIARIVIANQNLKGSPRASVLSSYIFEHQGLLVNEEFIESTRGGIRPPSVKTRAEKLLRTLARNTEAVGLWNTLPLIGAQESLKAIVNGDFAGREAILRLGRYLAASWSATIAELRFLLEEVLVSELEWVEQNKSNTSMYRVRAKGWTFLDSGFPTEYPRIGFVAMSFNPDLLKFSREVIEPAILATGHDPLRIDNKEHVNRIDDEIIASIRTARFAVCDFTEQKKGVYFEAGLALGFRLPVIWVCHKDDMKDNHFDTRQFNTIEWTWDDLPEAAKRLETRIRAVVGDYNSPPPR